MGVDFMVQCSEFRVQVAASRRGGGAERSWVRRFEIVDRFRWPRVLRHDTLVQTFVPARYRDWSFAREPVGCVDGEES